MDIKRYDFDYRIAEVMPMLEEKQLYGTKALIRDLKTVVDEIREIRAKAIDEFADRLSKYLNVESATKYGNKDAEQQRNSYDTLMKYEIADAIDDIAEQMKAGGKNE